MTAISVRDAVPSDLEVVLAWNLAMARESEARDLDPETVRRGVDAVLRDPARGLYFVAEEGGEPSGQLMVTTEWSDWRNGFFWWIQSVYVRPESRGRGVFEALYRHVEARARGAGDACGLRLYVERENERARRVYVRLGMVETAYRLLEVDWS